MIRGTVAVLIVAAVLVLIAFAVCIENRPQGIALPLVKA